MALSSPVVALLPKPARLQVTGGTFHLNRTTQLLVDAPDAADVRRLTNALCDITGLPLWSGSAAGCCIRIEPHLADALGADGYRLAVRPDGLRIVAAAPAGAYYACQALRQLIPPRPLGSGATAAGWEVPCVEIEDRPRFIWRGLMLDCSRHFWPSSFIKRFIDLMAMHRMNVFHWHLTDDQGWRLEIRKYPKLTEVGAWRSQTLIGHVSELPHQFDGRRYGGFYTQAEAREIIAYAADRYINVMPEIEMPGHSRAAIAAYPELGCVNEPLEPWGIFGVSGDNTVNADDSTIRFFQNVLDEVMEVFPSKFIHIGGDEANKDRWVGNPRIQARIRELGLKDEQALQAWFIRQMDRHLTERGRRLVGWDEIREGGLAPGATVMSWRGSEGGIASAQSGHDVVMTNSKFTYLDHYQGPKETEPLAIHGFTTLEKAYQFEPAPADLSVEQARHVLGMQGQLWTEYIADQPYADYMMFPRACALAEVMWSAPAGRDFAEFRQRLVVHLDRLKAAGVNYRPLDPVSS